MTNKTLSLLAGFLAFSTATSQAQRSVVTAYRELQKIDESIALYPLTQKGEDWKTMSVAEYELNAKVDTKNGYIEIQDEGTGGGTLTTQVVLYRKADGNELVVFNRRTFDGVSTDTEIAMYESDGKNWTALDPKMILPLVQISDFLSKPTDNRRADAYLDVYYVFPQYGTTAKMLLETSQLDYSCGEGDADAPCELLDQIKYHSIELKWDKTQKQFSVGNKE